MHDLTLRALVSPHALSYPLLACLVIACLCIRVTACFCPTQRYPGAPRSRGFFFSNPINRARRQRRRKSEKPARAPEAVGPEWYAEQRLAKRMAASLLPLSSEPMQLRRARSKSRADFPAVDRAASLGTAVTGAALNLDSKGSSRVRPSNQPLDYPEHALFPVSHALLDRMLKASHFGAACLVHDALNCMTCGTQGHEPLVCPALSCCGAGSCGKGRFDNLAEVMQSARAECGGVKCRNVRTVGQHRRLCGASMRTAPTATPAA
jgi:hypothetical protein